MADKPRYIELDQLGLTPEDADALTGNLSAQKKADEEARVDPYHVIRSRTNLPDQPEDIRIGNVMRDPDPPLPRIPASQTTEPRVNNLQAALGEGRPTESATAPAPPPTKPKPRGPAGPSAQKIYDQVRLEGAQHQSENVGQQALDQEDIYGRRAQAAYGEAEAHQQNVDAYNQQNVDTLREREVRDRAMSQAREKIQIARKELAKNEIDPDRVWKQRGPGAKMLSAIGVGLGALGATIAGTPNFAQQARESIDREIERDIEAQKANYEHKSEYVRGMETDYARLREQGLDDEHTRSLINANYKNIAASMIDRQVAMGQGNVNQAQGRAMSDKLKGDAQQLVDTTHEAIAKDAYMREKAAAEQARAAELRNEARKFELMKMGLSHDFDMEKLDAAHKAGAQGDREDRFIQSQVTREGKDMAPVEQEKQELGRTRGVLFDESGKRRDSVPGVGGLWNVERLVGKVAPVARLAEYGLLNEKERENVAVINRRVAERKFAMGGKVVSGREGEAIERITSGHGTVGDYQLMQELDEQDNSLKERNVRRRYSPEVNERYGGEAAPGPSVNFRPSEPSK